MKNNLQIRREQIRVGQVVDEDDDYVTLKIAKNDLVGFDVSEGHAFFTLLFVQADNDGIKADFPWG